VSEKGTTAMDGGFVPLSSGANTLTPEGMELLIPDSGINRCPCMTAHRKNQNNILKT